MREAGALALRSIPGERAWIASLAAGTAIAAIVYAYSAYAFSPFLLPMAVAGAIVIALILPRPAWGLGLALLALPLELYSLPLPTGALSVSEGLFLLVAMGWVWRAMVSPSEVVLPSLRDAPIIAILLATALGILVASETTVSVVMRISILWVGYYLVYLQVQSLQPSEMRWILIAFAVGAGILGFIGTIDYLGSATSGLSEGGLYVSERASGTFIDANYYAAALVLAIMPAVVIALSDPGRYWWLFGFIALAVSGVLFSFSRGGMLALAVGLLVLIWWGKFRRTAVLLVVIVALFAFTDTLPVVSNTPLASVQQRLSTVTSGSAARTSRRPRIWSLATRQAIEHPFLGIGAQNFKIAASEHGLIEFGRPVENVHNQFLNFAAENGVIALLAFLILIGQWLVRCINSLRVRDAAERAVAFGLLAAFVGFIVQALTVAPLRVNVIAAVFFLLGGMITALADRQRRVRAGQVSPPAPG